MNVIEIRNPNTGMVMARVVREADAGYIAFADGTTLRCDRAALVTDPIAITPPDTVCRNLPTGWVYE